MLRLVSLISIFGVVSSLAAFDPIYFANVYYNKLKDTDATVMGMNVITQSSSGINERATTSIGLSDILNGQKLWLDNAFRMGTGSDTLFYALTLRLVGLNVLPSLNAAIPSQYFPRGVTDLYNPSYPTIPLTLEMLLRHTSTLSDAGFDDYRQTTPSGVVTDFTTFCESYFTVPKTVNGVTTYSAAQTIWTNANQPGAANSYRYARANTALLGFIINAAILGNPTLVTGATKTVAGYLQEQFLSPLGMSSTFRRNVDGSYPKTTLPSNMDLYPGLPVTPITANGNAKADVYIHPAYPADYMFYTTSENVGRFVRSLFIDTTTGISFSSIGSQMKASPITLGSSATNRKVAQVGQGYGLMYLSGSTLCANTLTYASMAKCVLTDRTTIFGSYAVERTNMWGFFCLTVNGDTTCTTVMIHYFDTAAGSTKDPGMLLGVAGIMLSNALGAYTDTDGAQTGGTKKEFDEGLNGLWVALGTCLVIVFVIAAAYFTEYLVQPAPVPAGVVAAPPPIPQAYGHVEQGMYAEGAPGFYHD